MEEEEEEEQEEEEEEEDQEEEEEEEEEEDEEQQQQHEPQYSSGWHPNGHKWAHSRAGKVLAFIADSSFSLSQTRG